MEYKALEIDCLLDTIDYRFRKIDNDTRNELFQLLLESDNYAETYRLYFDDGCFKLTDESKNALDAECEFIKFFQYEFMV